MRCSVCERQRDKSGSRVTVQTAERTCTARDTRAPLPLTRATDGSRGEEHAQRESGRRWECVCAAAALAAGRSATAARNRKRTPHTLSVSTPHRMPETDDRVAPAADTERQRRRAPHAGMRGCRSHHLQLRSRPLCSEKLFIGCHSRAAPRRGTRSAREWQRSCAGARWVKCGGFLLIAALCVAALSRFIQALFVPSLQSSAYTFVAMSTPAWLSRREQKKAANVVACAPVPPPPTPPPERTTADAVSSELFVKEQAQQQLRLKTSQLSTPEQVVRRHLWILLLIFSNPANVMTPFRMPLCVLLFLQAHTGAILDVIYYGMWFLPLLVCAFYQYPTDSVPWANLCTSSWAVCTAGSITCGIGARYARTYAPYVWVLLAALIAYRCQSPSFGEFALHHVDVHRSAGAEKGIFTGEFFVPSNCWMPEVVVAPQYGSVEFPGLRIGLGCVELDLGELPPNAIQIDLDVEIECNLFLWGLGYKLRGVVQFEQHMTKSSECASPDYVHAVFRYGTTAVVFNFPERIKEVKTKNIRSRATAAQAEVTRIKTGEQTQDVHPFFQTNRTIPRT